MPTLLPSFGDPEFDALLRKGQTLGALNSEELEAAIDGMYRIRLLDATAFGKVKAALGGLRAQEPRSARMIAEIRELSYAQYMQRRMLASESAIPQVAYRADHIPKETGHNRRPGRAMTAKYLTIHSTGNPRSTAKNERGWLTNATNDRTASFHVVVDQDEAVECIPLNEVAWHAGDGSSGSGNSQSIGLEICESGDRGKTLENAIAVAATILRQQNLPASSLRRHNDWSGKVCPRILIDAAFRAKPGHTWDWFRGEVAKLL